MPIAPGRMISKITNLKKKWRKRKVKEFSKGIYVKFKPEEVDVLHNRRERIRQLYTELYKEKNITKFRNTKISVERKVVA